MTKPEPLVLTGSAESTRPKVGLTIMSDWENRFMKPTVDDDYGATILRLHNADVSFTYQDRDWPEIRVGLSEYGVYDDEHDRAYLARIAVVPVKIEPWWFGMNVTGVLIEDAWYGSMDDWQTAKDRGTTCEYCSGTTSMSDTEPHLVGVKYMPPRAGHVGKPVELRIDYTGRD